MNSSYHERISRGTPEFPLELYTIDSAHPRYRMQAHWHKDFEIIRVLKGSLKLKLNEKEFELKENQGIFIPGGIIHSAIPDNCVYECLVFAPAVLYNIQTCKYLIKAHIQKAVIYQNNESINSVFDRLKDSKRGYELEVIGMLYLLSADIVKNNSCQSIAPNERLEKIKSAMLIIEENYTSKITLAELAASCRLSPNYFCKYFKEIVGQTPVEYITVYRIEAACEMLRESDKSITDICFACGFNDLSYFIHIFKKHKGVSPREYVKQLNGR